MTGNAAVPTFDGRGRRVCARISASPRVPYPVRIAAARLLRRVLPLSDLSPEEIVGLATKDRSGFAVVAGPAIEAPPGDVLNLADTTQLVAPVVTYLRAPTVESEARSAALYRVIVLERASGDRNRLWAALLTVWHVAARMRLSDQRGTLERCLTLAAQPIDPYDPQPLTLAARAAGAALLQSTSTLDDAFVERMRQREPGAPDLAAMLAVALQGRVRDRPALLARTLAAWGPDRATAMAFAAAADVRSSTSDPVAPASPAARLFEHFRQVAGSASAVALASFPVAAASAAGPAIAAIAWSVAALLPTPPRPPVSPAEAFGALGLLVAVHVVAAELAADRLRGIVARHTSTPRPLLAGESMAVTLLFVVGAELPNDTEARQWIAVMLLGALVMALLGTLYRLVARTDPVVAVRAFRRAQRRTALRSGRKLGAINSRAAAARDAIAALGWARTFVTEPRMQRRHRFLADQRGFFVVDERQLRRLDREPQWRNEDLQLRVASRIGVIIDAGEEILSILATDDAVLSHNDIRAVKRCYSIEAPDELDAMAESTGALIGLAVELGEQGNGAGALEVAEQLAELLLEHQGAARRARAGEKTELASAPALLATAELVVGELSEGRAGLPRNALRHVLQRVLAGTTASEGFAAIVVQRVSIAFADLRKDSPTSLGLTWDAAQHALEVGDDVGLRAARAEIERHIDQQANVTRALETAARFAQLATFVRYERSLTLYRWFRRVADDPQIATRLSLRVGASALLAGHMSLAVEVALDLAAVDFDALIDEFLESKAVVDTEQEQSEMYHYVLGADAQYALQEFARFARDTTRAVAA